MADQEYEGIITAPLQESLQRYLALTGDTPVLIIVDGHGGGWTVIARFTRKSSSSSEIIIPYHDSRIRVPLTHGYPVITSRYSIVRNDFFTLSWSIVSSSYQYTEGGTNSSHIPAVTYQTFETRVVPTAMKVAIDRTITFYPDYRYVTTADSERFLAHHFPPRVGKAFQALRPGSFKADLWRVCQLYITGGLYLDVKLYCLRSLEHLLRTHQLLLVIDRHPRSLWNGIMGSVPGHPYLKILIEMIVDNVERRSYGSPHPGIFNITGPGTCYQAFESYLGTAVPDRPGSYGDYYLLSNNGEGTMGDDNYEYFSYRHPTHPVTGDDCYRATGNDYYGLAYQRRRIYED